MGNLTQHKNLAPVTSFFQSNSNHTDPLNIAWVIPCLNEEVAIAKVIGDIQIFCPGSQIHVFDNGSTDRTATIASVLGATVHTVALRGKGHVVQRMFAAVRADIYIMVDGDDTYDISRWALLVEPVAKNQADMSIGCRLNTSERKAFRAGHRLGNAALTGILNLCFSQSLKDILSGGPRFPDD